jgi:hypothetical protein
VFSIPFDMYLVSVLLATGSAVADESGCELTEDRVDWINTAFDESNEGLLYNGLKSSRRWNASIPRLIPRSGNCARRYHANVACYL